MAEISGTLNQPTQGYIAQKGKTVLVKGFEVKVLTFQTHVAAKNWVKGSGIERLTYSRFMADFGHLFQS